MARQQPRAWPNETPEDVAVFDASAFETLPPDAVDYVNAVRDALQMVSESRGDAAIDRVRHIPRGSRLSEWRLFLRGYVPWTNNDPEAAQRFWSRLDPERRPSRIAIALMASLRTDLDSIKITGNASEQNIPPSEDADADSRLDNSLLYSAKLVRRIRIDRAAIRVAEAGTSEPTEDDDLFIGPKKLKWLKEFAGNYQDTEPQLVAALQRTALRCAFAQPYIDIFEDVMRAIPGPPHDPKNSLLSFFYYTRFKSSQSKAETYFAKYLDNDLPNNTEISEPLRNAIISQASLDEARHLMEPAEGFGFFGNGEDTKTIRKYLNQAAQAYPSNRQAHEAHVEWLRAKSDDERLRKAQRESYSQQLADAMKRWANAIPTDVEPRLWLVDHLLENEELDEAQPHVEFLASARHDDPRVRATPWKWQLLEAMRLCRRKAWLPQVSEKLTAAEQSWPPWLSKEWLPYLRAAYYLRCDDKENYDQQRATICRDSGLNRDGLADACMMLAAAQRMRVPAAGLKPLRVPVEEALKNLTTLDTNELLAAGSFFWDRQRTQMVYPAYRMHGSKFGRELWRRIGQDPTILDSSGDRRSVHAALFWCSEHRFWNDGYGFSVPPVVLAQARDDPFVAAALLNAMLKLRYARRIGQFTSERNLVRTASADERDPFYRYWFAITADRVDAEIEKNRSGGFGFNAFANAFHNLFGDYDFDGDDDFDDFDDDDDFDDFDDDDESDDDHVDDFFDPECDCPNCQAARVRALFNTTDVSF